MLAEATLIVSAVLSAGVATARDTYSHVRMEQRGIARLVDDAVRRSPTFASLVLRLQATDVVVFVRATTLLEPRIVGRTVLVNATPAVRYLLSEVRADASEHEIIITIAHELQHAVEIAASGVRDQRAMARLFDAIGERHGRGFESDEARVVGARVRSELSRRPSRVAAAKLERTGY